VVLTLEEIAVIVRALVATTLHYVQALRDRPVTWLAHQGHPLTVRSTITRSATQPKGRNQGTDKKTAVDLNQDAFSHDLLIAVLILQS
jgi:hypothetical protein